jgi:hypothetical protein
MKRTSTKKQKARQAVGLPGFLVLISQ